MGNRLLDLLSTMLLFSFIYYIVKTDGISIIVKEAFRSFLYGLLTIIILVILISFPTYLVLAVKLLIFGSVVLYIYRHIEEYREKLKMKGMNDYEKLAFYYHKITSESFEEALDKITPLAKKYNFKVVEMMINVLKDKIKARNFIPEEIKSSKEQVSNYLINFLKKLCEEYETFSKESPKEKYKNITIENLKKEKFYWKNFLELLIPGLIYFRINKLYKGVSFIILWIITLFLGILSLKSSHEVGVTYLIIALVSHILVLVQEEESEFLFISFYALKKLIINTCYPKIRF